MEFVDTGENLSGLSVQTLGQTPIKTANKSCKHRSDSCVFDWSISVSAIHAPSVPLRSSQLACSVPSEHPVTGKCDDWVLCCVVLESWLIKPAPDRRCGIVDEY